MAKAKTEAQLKKLQQELEAKRGEGKTFALSVELDGDDTNTRTVFLKRPDRVTRSAAQKVAANDMYKGVEVFLRGMYLGGDEIEEIIGNEEALLQAGEAIAELITVKPAKLLRF